MWYNNYDIVEDIIVLMCTRQGLCGYVDSCLNIANHTGLKTASVWWNPSIMNTM